MSGQLGRAIPVEDLDACWPQIPAHLEASGFKEVDDWLDSVRQFWNQRLDQLERVLGKQDEGDQS